MTGSIAYKALTHYQELHTFCWLYRENDAWLATAGTDTQIHIISLALSQEMVILEGHASKWMGSIGQVMLPLLTQLNHDFV